MAVLSPFNLIRGLASFHLLLAYFFLTSPRKLADQSVVYLFGESMRIPHVSAFDRATPTTAFLAAVFTLLGLSDLTAAAQADEVAIPYWSSQAPVRLFFFFGLTAYTYVYKPGGFSAARGTFQTLPPGHELKNSVIFTWGFIELIMWFWIYTSMKEERRRLAIKILERKRAGD